ncbi:universal stress protein [Embleya scabrispora]|uniref:universal stress protein n=1 Tax=Embleya scabrispora TaxID=159449 RepID=UPI0003731A29|nr:universal stress protein [Embleya scabrispora]MYS79167.1 universal stress protein [Streptomyces sp. SID5474]
MNDNTPAGGIGEAGDGPERGHVIVGVDGSPVSDLATDRAADAAARRHVPLEVLHVVEWSPTREEDHQAAQLREVAAALVDRAAERARLRHPDLRIVTTVVLAHTVAALEEAGDRAALLVLGSRGLGGFAGLLMGSVSLSVAAGVRCPILIVRARQTSAPEDEPGSVVVGVSQFDCSLAIEAAFAEAQARGVPLRAVYARSHPSSPAAPYAAPLWAADNGYKAAEADLAAALAPFLDRYPHVSLTEQVVRDTPAHALVGTSDEADLVVLAAHRRHARFGANLGHVTHTLLHHCKAPVLLIPVD